MNIAPVNHECLDCVSQLPVIESEDQITSITSPILSAMQSAIQGGASREVAISLDLPTLSEVLKAQLIATGDNPEALWALAALESDPIKRVDALKERIESGQELPGMLQIEILHLLHKKTPELEASLIDSFLVAIESQKIALYELGALIVYLLHQDHKEPLERLITILQNESANCLDIDLDDLITFLVIVEVLSGLSGQFRPLSDLDPVLCERLGSFLVSLEERAPLVCPENYLVARLLQGQDVDTIVQSCQDPTYRAMVYSVAAIFNCARNTQVSEELLERAVELAGEEATEISCEDRGPLYALFGSSVQEPTVSIVGPSAQTVRACIAFGVALKNPQLGVARLQEALAKSSDEESVEIAATLTCIAMVLNLYQDKHALALELLDALLAKGQELGVFEHDGGIALSSLVLSAFFPERKEELLALVSEDASQLSALRLSLDKENLAQALGALSQYGLGDLFNTDILAKAAVALAVLDLR